MVDFDDTVVQGRERHVREKANSYFVGGKQLIFLGGTKDGAGRIGQSQYALAVCVATKVDLVFRPWCLRSYHKLDCVSLLPKYVHTWKDNCIYAHTLMHA